jgi:peptidyl-prolyl cis-trans isomerase SurA
MRQKRCAGEPWCASLVCAEVFAWLSPQSFLRCDRPRPAFAQAIIASINGDPITNIDIDERMKMLRVLHKPATREAAIESLYG